MKNYQFNMYLFMFLQTAMTNKAYKGRVTTPSDKKLYLTGKHFVCIP